MDKSDIGREGRPQIMHVEYGKIREFARAIKDDNPIYFDPERASEIAGGVMPPPTFSMTIAHWDDGSGRPPLGLDLRRLLHGEQEFEYLAPVYAGDVLTSTTRVADVFEKSGGRGGTMKFVVLESTFVNQNGNAVLRTRSTLIETGKVVERNG
jgi:acyl dehydratase